MSFAWKPLLACAAILGVAGLSAASAQDIAAAPPFDTQALTALPAADWITNGGNIFNQRYSPLDQINRDNIGELKGVWKTSLNGSGAGPGYSGQAQALAYDGVVYVVTGADDVFALDVETGEHLWTYEAGLDLEKYNICCGWLSRGVGMGDGRIYVGQLDASLVALDQKTGETLWKTTVEDWEKGYSITGAPLYYDGMVITGVSGGENGVSGGENGVRGSVTAYDAATGEQIWRFYTVPGPGEFGHDTWPSDNDSWMYGGAPVWQTPAVDPELGLIYFSTGNAGPDLNGANREGDNLFAVSVVALDVKTGEYKWHFQEVRHDIWDYDAPNPVILFDAEYDGQTRKGLAQVNKAGYLYILDRTDGSPLTPIVDTPVPQEPIQKTAATQPIPQGDTVTIHEVDAVGEDYVGILPNRGRTFTPFGPEGGNYAPGSATNWTPSSYNPDNHLMYICSNYSVGGGTGGDPTAGIGPDEQGNYLQGAFRGRSGVGGGQRRRFLVAMDLTDHSRLWRRELEERCAGVINTAGGLIFAGRTDGRMTALDSDTGQKIWEYRVDHSVFTTATTFEHDGVQYVGFLAGGSLLGGGGSDSFWMMSLNGDMEPMPEPEPDADEVGGPAAGAVAAAPPSETPAFDALPAGRMADLASGESIYRTICQTCHGASGEGGHDSGAPLTPSLTIPTIMQVATDGRPDTDMASFSAVYTPEQLHDVATFIHDVILPRAE